MFMEQKTYFKSLFLHKKDEDRGRALLGKEQSLTEGGLFPVRSRDSKQAKKEFSWSKEIASKRCCNEIGKRLMNSKDSSNT